MVFGLFGAEKDHCYGSEDVDHEISPETNVGFSLLALQII